MRAVFGFVGILMVLGIGFLIYSNQLQSGPGGAPLPQQTNLTAVRTDLLSLGQAERLYFATNGHYATMEQLKASGVTSVLPGSGRGGYRYDIETEGADNFRITATPSGPGGNLPTLSIDKRMQISS
jgi:hypothetical protein